MARAAALWLGCGLVAILLRAGERGAVHASPGAESLVVEVTDAATGAPLPARIVVRDAQGKVAGSYYRQLPGAFTGDDGKLELPLAAGRYTLAVHRGIDYVSHEQALEVRQGQHALTRVALEPWVRLREQGWANGDGHAHLYTDNKPDTEMAKTVRRICRGQGVDFICACQGWAGYDDGTWKDGFAEVSDRSFRLHYGAEMPKYRTGHTFWYGLSSTRGLFDAAMDETYENAYYQAPTGTDWTFETLPFPNIPDLELVSRLRTAEDAVALVPHPTSWWWQPRGQIEKFATNIAASLPVGMLAGGLFDGLVVMGYDRDHYFYEDLWFHLLDEGFRLPPVGELDGGYSPDDRFYYGRVRTYLKAGADASREAIVSALRQGHTFVTSGPIVLASVDGRYEVGDVVPADGQAHALHVRAFASGQRDDALSFLVLFRNSRVHKVWDLRQQKPRQFEADLSLQETGPAWYVLKAYAKDTARTPEQLDVRTVVDEIVAGRFTGPLADADVAVTSPFYFRRPGEAAQPAALESHLRLQLVDATSRQPVRDARLTVQVEGRTVEIRALPDGRGELRVPVHAVLRIEAPNRPTLRRVLYLDTPAMRARVERIATGHWLEQYGGRGKMQPGQVPWDVFDLAGTRRDLSEVDWTIPWAQNERDDVWERFETKLAAPAAATAAAGDPYAMPAEFQRQSERRIAEYLPRLRDRIRTEDPALNALVERLYAQCVTGKLFDPMPPELPHRWFAPGGSYYLGQWLWDTMFVAIAAAPLGDDAALRDVFENYWYTIDNNPDAAKGSPRYGMVPNFLGARMLREGHKGWPPVGYSQIPILGWGVLGVYRQTQDRALVERALPYLAAFDDWYSSERDVDGDGLVEYGAYEPVFRNDLLQTARFETFDFHLPLDGMKMTPHRGRPGGGAFYGNVEGVEQTSFLIMSERAIAELARELGDEALARRVEARIQRRVQAMRAKMWDEERRFFFSLDRDSDRRIPVRTLQGFLTLAAGVATPEQTEALVGHLRDPRGFAAPYPVPTAAVDEAKYDSKGYWRGDMWPPTTYLVAYGLRRYGYHDLALDLTRRLRTLIEARGVAEHYDSQTGAPLGVPGLGMSVAFWSMVVENVYGVQDDFRSIRVPRDAVGRRLRLGGLSVAYPRAGTVEIASAFAREMRVVVPGASSLRVGCGGAARSSGSVKGEARFTIAAGETCFVEDGAKPRLWK
jgi:hypothetical protein